MSETLSSFLQKIQCLQSFRQDIKVFTAALKSCTAVLDIKLGKALHTHAIKLGHSSSLLLSKALLNMYAKWEAFGDSSKLFSELSHRDAVTWNILLSGFAGSKKYDNEVVRLFYKMHTTEYLKPSFVSIAIVLPVCARLQALDAGKSVHAYGIKSGLECLTLVGNALVSLYAKCGCVHNDAYTIFHMISEKDVISWNAMISGYAENMFIDNAFKLFRLMIEKSVLLNYATIVNILPLCSCLEDNLAHEFGKEIHCYVMRRAELASDVSVSNALVSFYLKIGQVSEAEMLFKKMKFRDLVSWNSIIAGYASNGKQLKALEAFCNLLHVDRLDPDSVTLFSILPAASHLKNLSLGKQIHGYVIRHTCLNEETGIGNALIHFYARCNDIRAAFKTFLLICNRDLISWNSMLDAFVNTQSESQFVDLLQWMIGQGIMPDSVTILTMLQYFATHFRVDKIKEAHSFSIKYGLMINVDEPTLANAILDAYAKCGNMHYASKVFEGLSLTRNVVTCNTMISGYANFGSVEYAQMMFQTMSKKDITSWNLMIQVYAKNDYPGVALTLFHELQCHGMKPDAMTIMGLLSVCAHTASVQLLRQCHKYVTSAWFDDLYLMGAFIDVYAKCGSITYAHKLFQSASQKDLVMFTAMVGGYAMHGLGKEAIGIFNSMLELGVKPDHVILTTVLAACSHSCLVDEGLRLFYSMDKLFGIKPCMEHYACVVDLLARGGRIDDACSFVSGLPIEANANIWGTLLGACRTHQEVDQGRAIADYLFDIETQNIGNYVVMSNLYAANARWDGVSEMRRLLRTRGLKKPAACSWIEVEMTRNVFIAGDSSHPKRSTIYQTLSTMDQLSKSCFSSELVEL